MKQVLLLVAMFFATHAAFGQTTPEQPGADANAQQQAGSEPVYQQLHDTPPQLRMLQQPQAQGLARKSSASERWRYDPAARREEGEQRPSTEPGVERASEPNSPCSVPYNGLLAEWRIPIVKAAIERFYHRALPTLLICQALILACIAWLLHQRERQLQTTGGIISQLWNAHVFARQNALETIKAHNKLVAELDAEDEAAEAESKLRVSTLPVAAEGAAVGNRASPAVQQNTPASEESQVLSGAFSLSPKGSPDERSPEGVANSAAGAMAGESFALHSGQENGAELSATEDIEALKLALQKVNAQLTSRDAQLRAKDDKIASQRQLISELNNRPRNNGETGRGTN
jgi:hypothetical protein